MSSEEYYSKDSSEGISVIIRNKNEADSLQTLLPILTDHYSDDINEIILVDNNSTDDSVHIAKKYACRIVNIEKFSYGSAINLGIQNSRFDYCVLLSSHVIPIGSDFFKNVHHFFSLYKDAGGLRFCRNQNDVISFYRGKNSQHNANIHGLLASGSAIRKKVWEKVPFDEKLLAAEDKDWTKRIGEINKIVYIIPSFYCYVDTRSWRQEVKKYKIEKQAHYEIFGELESGSFLRLSKEIYRAFKRLTHRLKIVFSRYYIDITFKK